MGQDTRALFVCPNLQAGGAERHWSLLVPRLAGLGLDPRVLTLDGRGPFFERLSESGVPVATVADVPRRWRKAAGLRAMVMNPGDVIVSRATSADALACIASALRPSTRWAVNWHFPSGMTMQPRREAILRATLPRADAILAVCSSQIADLARFGVRAESVTVVANGTDFDPSQTSRAVIRQTLGLGEEDVAALFVGRLEAQKRVDRFIDVVVAARREVPQIVGLIAGVGPLQEQLASQIARSGGPIRMVGRRDDMPEVLAAVDVLTLMSDYEALPFVVLEAMAAGRPVLATDVGGLADVVVEGETGLLVERGDEAASVRALVALARSSALRQRLGGAGQARQRRLYTADQMSERFATALSKLT